MFCLDRMNSETRELRPEGRGLLGQLRGSRGGVRGRRRAGDEPLKQEKNKLMGMNPS